MNQFLIMKVQTKKTKHTLALIISSLIVTVVIYLTIRLTGHAKSGGILFIIVFFMDLTAIFLLAVLSSTKLLRTKAFWIFTTIIILSLIGYFIFHRTYDSYKENRRILWGLNGE